MPNPLPVLSYKPNSGGVSIDLDALIVSRLLVQGVSGSGKSSALRAMLEQTHGRVQHFVIDREGEFATLRTRFPYVLAGGEGDVPAEVNSAKLLVRRVVELGASVIVDLSDLKLHDQREYVRRAFDELIHLPRELWRPLVVVLDEAHLFCPERGSGESVATQAVIDVATLGRKRGFCLVAATQRLSKLHKDCAAELLNKLIGYTDDVDLQRVGDQLGMTKDQRATLKTLEWGESYVYGPAVSKKPLLVRTPETQTKAPPRGAARPPAPPAPAAIRSLVAQLHDLPKQAAEEARSIDELKRENQTLRGQVRQLERAKPPAPPAVPVEVPVLKDGQVKRLEQTCGRLADIVKRHNEQATAIAQQIAESCKPIAAALATLQRPGARPSAQNGAAAVRAAPLPVRAPARAAARPPATDAGGLQISGSQRRILDALAWLESVGISEAKKAQLALLADQSPSSSAFANNLGALRSAGCIQYPAGGIVAITVVGREHALVPDGIPTTEDLHRALFARLPGPQVKILQALIAAHPASVEKAELAGLVDASPTSSAYANNLGALRSLGFIDYPRQGEVVALPVLFLEERS